MSVSPPPVPAQEAQPARGPWPDVVAWSIGIATVATFIAGVVLAPQPMPDFAMTVQGGKTMHLSSFHGKWVVATFGCTSCPQASTANLSNLARVVARLGSAADQLRVLFISIDPDHDTPHALAAYVHRFAPDFIGARVPLPELTEVASEFDVAIPQAMPAGPSGKTRSNPLDDFEIVDPGGHLKGPQPPPLHLSDLTKILGLL